MPLSCLADGQEIFAHRLAASAFEELRKANAANGHLRMCCCASAVTLRTSKLGTRHFAHARRGDCTTAPETAEHLLAKSLIASVAEAAGWSARTEARGVTPTGEAWIADVLATKPGEAPIAFEVQWSRQGAAETASRTDTLRRSGVQAVWLMRQPDLPSSPETPAAKLALSACANFEVSLPAWEHEETAAAGGRGLQRDSAWLQKMDLAEFVSGVLEARLHFGLSGADRLRLTVRGASIDCWRCRKPTMLVLGIGIAHAGDRTGLEVCRPSIYDFDDGDECRRFLQETLPTSLLRQHGIGAIKARASKTEGRSYLSNGCVRCDALQGRFYEHEVFWEEAPIFDTTVDAPIIGYLAALAPAHKWWLAAEQFSRHPLVAAPSDLSDSTPQPPAGQAELF